MDAKGHNGKQRDRPVPGGEKTARMKFRARLACWASKWGVDLLLVLGAGCVSAGVGWIYPPAGLIAAGVLLIAGGVLLAKGKGGDDP